VRPHQVNIRWISVARNDVKPANIQQNDGFGCRGQNFGQNLYFTKGISAVHSALRLINEFSAKGWKKNTLNDFVKRLKQTGSITKKSGSSRPRCCQSAPHTTNSSHGQLIKQSIHHITVVICKMGIAQVWKAVWEMPCKKSVKCVRYVYAKSATASRTQLAVLGN